MKRTIKQAAFVAVVAIVTTVSVFTFQSCSGDTENATATETKLTTEQSFAKDLQRLANAQRKFAEQLTTASLNRRTSEMPSDSTGLPAGCQSAVQEVTSIMTEMAQNYNLTADLTEHQIEGLYIDDELRDIISLDPEAFSAYVEEYKSEEFNNIMNTMQHEPFFTLTVESIIQNNNLKMNEKIGLLAACIMDEYVVGALPMDPKPMGPDGYKVVSCEDTFKADRASCFRAYELDVAAIIAADLMSGGTGSVFMIPAFLFVSAKYVDCEMQAKKHYDACVYQRNNNK